MLRGILLMQNVNTYVVYDDSNGAIRMIVKTLVPPKQTPDGTSILITNDNVKSSNRVELSDLSIATKLTLPDGQWSGNYYEVPVPAGTKAFWQGECYEVDDGLLEVLVDQPGVHSLKLTHPIYETRGIDLENQQIKPNSYP